MRIKTNPSLRFQTFFASREICSSPLTDHVIRFSQYLDEKKLIDEISGSISIDNGNRILINSEGASLARLTREGIVEVVDYDPIKNIVLAIGASEPCIYTPLHWMIQRARYDIHAVVLLEGDRVIERFKTTSIPTVEHRLQPCSLELIKEVLRTLRNNNIIRINDTGVLIIGNSLKDIEGVLDRYS